jgi:oligoribonuclease
MDQIAWLAWLDLETTGTDEHEDPIIEVAVVLTRPDLSEQTEPFHRIVSPPDLSAAVCRIAASGPVQAMHDANGLLDALKAGVGDPIGAVDQDLRAWLKEHSKPKRSVMIAGSGVGHFDRRFVAAQMPQTDAHLWYPAFDVGVFRRMLQCWGAADLAGQPGAKTHRALDDVLDHIAEAQRYKAMVARLMTEPS